MKQVLMVIAPSVFRDEEYAHPKEILEARGVHVTTASTRQGTCTGRFGLKATADIALADVVAEDYDAIAFVGGGGAEVFFDDPQAHALARTALESGRILGAICIAPSTLAHAGLLEGVAVTAFPSQREDLIAHGALWRNEPVVIDGPIITASGPEAARDFGRALAEALLRGVGHVT